MKSPTTSALILILCVPATAQQVTPGQQPLPQRPSIEYELQELEQDADKALLREALLLQGRLEMKSAPDHDADSKRDQKEADALRGFITKKKEAIVARAAELRASRAAGLRSPSANRGRPAELPTNTPDLIEKIEKTQVDTQLLQTQVNLLQQPLSEAIDTLAVAEFAASDDETQRPKAEAARKAFEKVKAKHVELSKRLQVGQYEMQSMRQTAGIGMMGGMGGMGGGFR